MSTFESLSDFHFIRPYFLLGLLLLPIFWFAIRKRANNTSDWGTAIAPELLKYLMPAQDVDGKKTPYYSLLVLLTATFISLAGPSWQEKPQPIVKLSDDMVVILDLSLSMLATDIKPNRLTKTKQKLQDLLKIRVEGNTALIAFSGDSHVVTPLTDDINTISANLPALDPFIMPVIGSRPDIAISQAISLLEQGNARNGRIILFSDGVTEAQANEISDLLDASGATLSIVAIGTEAGGPIDIPGRGYFKDEGKVIIPKSDFSLFHTLATSHGGSLVSMSLDEKDLTQLDISGENFLKQINQEETERSIDKRFDSWEDMGYLLILIIIPLALFAHRQGALLSIFIVFLIPSQNAEAFEWNDLWITKDQQAQKRLDQGDHNGAAELFESPAHKANAQYMSGQFESAAENYGQGETVNDLYNRGNALAQQQKYDEALSLYKQALNQEPTHEDSLHNKSIVERLLEQQNQDQQNQDQQNQDQEQQNQDQQNQDQQNQDQQNQDQQNQDQQNQDQQNQEQQSQDQKEAELSEEEKAEKEKEREKARLEAQSQAEKLSDEEKQSYEQWMRRVPDDPGGLLRRKFEQQSIERKRTRSDDARRDGDPIW